MPVCSFCRKRYKDPCGLTIFTFDGRSIFYCSSKCRKNAEHLHRDPKKTKWVIKRAGYLQETGTREIIENVSENNMENSQKADLSEKKETAKKKK